MISKRVFLWSIVIISVVQLINCAAEVSQTDNTAAAAKPATKPAARSKAAAGSKTAAGSNANAPAVSKHQEPSAEETAVQAIDQNEEDTEKPNGLRQKVLKPIKFISMVFLKPIRFALQQLKNFKWHPKNTSRYTSEIIEGSLPTV